jgi:hypothetical protein
VAGAAEVLAAWATDRDQQGLTQGRPPAQPSGDFQVTCPGQDQIKQDDIRPEVLGHVACLWPVVGRLDVLIYQWRLTHCITPFRRPSTAL